MCAVWGFALLASDCRCLSCHISTDNPSPVAAGSPQILQSVATPVTNYQPTGGRRRKHPQKPGRHICPYCGRGCAKPSVLENHVRAHTNERPYPCTACDISFKTKSNLYKHSKSRAHLVRVCLFIFHLFLLLHAWFLSLLLYVHFYSDCIIF